MIDRIFNNWKSSMVGVFLLVVPLVLVYFEKATLSEVGVFWGVALTLIFFYKKDK